MKRRDSINGSPQVIGVLGIGHGCGATHTAMVLANYIANGLRIRTAVVEYNGNDDFMKIRRMAETVSHGLWDYTCKGIDIYARVDKDRLSRIMAGEHEVIIMDMNYIGSEATDELIREFARSSIKIAVCSLDMWRVCDLKSFLVNELHNIKNMRFWAQAYNAKRAKELEREFHVRIEQMAYEPDPMHILSKNMLWYKKQIY